MLPHVGVGDVGDWQHGFVNVVPKLTKKAVRLSFRICAWHVLEISSDARWKTNELFLHEREIETFETGPILRWTSTDDRLALPLMNASRAIDAPVSTPPFGQPPCPEIPVPLVL